MARHAATLCLARIAARRTPSDPSRNVVSGDAASDAAESLEDVVDPRLSALDAREKYDATGAESAVDREPRRACSATPLAFVSPPDSRAFSPTRERPDAMSATTVRVTAAHLCASAGFEPTASRCSNASDLAPVSRRGIKKTSGEADASASFPSRRARATPTTTTSSSDPRRERARARRRRHLGANRNPTRGRYRAAE